jgi:hypothetical protein
MRNNVIPAFTKGIHNLLSDELIPEDSARDSMNWVTRDGKIELVYGRQSQGAEGASGKNYGEHTAYMVNGTAVRFRKVTTKIQYLNGDTWTDVITGLVEGDCTFANYQSLAGAFVYIFDPNNGIYKICTANPASYASLYVEATNFKGYGLIEKGRTILWGRKEDPTGLYGSWIDNQAGVSGSTGVYTTITDEVLGSGDGTNKVFSGTLAFKAGGATRTCHALKITVTGGEVLTDDFNGVLTGNNGATGTINYMTGAWAITFDTAPASASNNIKCTYQWENSNLRGVTDFQKSATRLAGQGFMIRQDEGGDAIKAVLPYDGSYISLKARSAYQFTLDAADLNPNNQLIRSDIGVSSLRAGVSTSTGVVFLNTANPTKPNLHILERNPYGDYFTTKPLFEQFDFSKYDHSDVMVGSWDNYILVGTKYDSSENNRLLMCNMKTGTVDQTDYGIRTMTKDGGFVYGGDPVSQSSYELFTGFDDVGLAIDNYWISSANLLKSPKLKKVRRTRFIGQIDPNQIIAVYISRDNGDWLKVGTIRGDQDYVDYTTSYAVGTTMAGGTTIGGDDEVPVYRFYMELKLRGEKFRKRAIKFVAEGIGYVSIQQIEDFDVLHYEDRLPRANRTKQNVSIDGTLTNL